VDARGSRAPRTDALDLGQHLLPRPLAADLVEHALVDRDELIVEIGAGRGALTAALAERARAVIAIEVDPRFTRSLRSMFAGDPAVRIVEGDARTWPLPREPFRAFGNVPFAITTDLLRHLLDDPVGAMVRADLIVQQEVARKRVADPPRTVLSLGWGPWWTFAIERHLPARSFRPPPRVDAALLVIRRRERPLLPATDVQPYRRVVRELFVKPSRPVVQSVKAMVGEPAGRLVSDVGVSHRARVVDLRIADAVALFRRMRAYWSERD
jgi:23S rRNA (adenine-N6)-dimethyltransferase